MVMRAAAPGALLQTVKDTPGVLRVRVGWAAEGGRQGDR